MHQVNLPKLAHLAVVLAVVYAYCLLEIHLSPALNTTILIQAGLIGVLAYCLPFALPRNVPGASSLALVFTALLCLAVGIIVYLSTPGTTIGKDLVHAIIQTNPSEAWEFFDPLTAVLLSIVFFTLLWGLYRLYRHALPRSSTLPVLALASLGLVLTGVQAPYAWQFTQEAINEYHHEFAEYRRLRALRDVNEQVQAFKHENNEAYIVVIGESLNKHHMSLYGYKRQTTPELEKLHQQGKILVHPYAVSSHTLSQPVLKHALSSANQYNQKAFWNASSIIDAFNVAGFHTAWISNQTAYGPWDNLITILAEESDYELRTNKYIGKRVQSQNHDEVLVPYIREQLEQNATGNSVIFVHLIGSHAHYCKRYPESFELFSGSDDQNYDCYDNSVRYNDAVLANIFKLANDYGHIKGILYLADHGEDVLYRRRHDVSRYSDYMTEIPLMFQASNGYQALYPEKMQNLQSNMTKQVFVNDFLYDTALGMTNVEANLKTVEGDMFSEQYDSSRMTTTNGRPLPSRQSDYLSAANKKIVAMGHIAGLDLPPKDKTASTN